MQSKHNRNALGVARGEQALETHWTNTSAPYERMTWWQTLPAGLLRTVAGCRGGACLAAGRALPFEEQLVRGAVAVDFV